MCNRYTPGRADALAYFREHGFLRPRDESHIGDPLRPGLLVDIGPYGRGWFIRTRSDGSLEEVEGQWGLIGWFSTSAVPPRIPGRGGPILTNNARFETIAEKPTFKGPLAPWAALHHPGLELCRAELGERQEPVVAIPARRWSAVGHGGALEHLGRPGNRRSPRKLHDGHAECGSPSAAAAHASA